MRGHPPGRRPASPEPLQSRKAWLICRLKTALLALNIYTILLVLNLFVIIAAACLIITNGCTHAKWHAVGHPPPPTGNVHKDAGQGSNYSQGDQAPLVEAPLGWRNFTQEISPQDTFRLQGRGVLLVSCHFWKLDDRGRAPISQPPTEDVISYAHY